MTRSLFLVLPALLALLPAAALAQVGPDAYGYEGESVAPAFVPIAAVGSATGLADDGEVDVTLPWSFPFYGTGYATVRVGGNGGVRFSSGEVGFTNGCLPASATAAPDILALWDDLNATSAGDVYTWHDTAADRFLISWEGVPRYNAIGDSSFQIHLYADGAIELHYDDVDFGNATYDGGASATIGIQDRTGGTYNAGNALQWSCNTNTITAPYAIRFENCPDLDLDGFGDASCDTDCDDGDGNAYPGAPELCDGVDNDCDGFVLVDGEVDVDLDGSLSCEDCDDNDAARFPGNTEVCADAIDQDCTGLDALGDADLDTWTNVECGGSDCDDLDPLLNPGIDADLDGSDACLDCDDLDAFTEPGAPELCDGLDNDCDALVVAENDDDLDGSRICDPEPDCDDAEPAANPTATEICDGFDNDCDASTDDVDGDGDGFLLCTDDCDDTNLAIYPDAAETCDSVDDDCDGVSTGADLSTGAVTQAVTVGGVGGVAIPDPGLVTDTATVTAPGLSVLGDLVLDLDIAHTWNDDLDIFLISPSGTRVEVSTDNGGNGDGYAATFTDSAPSTPPTANGLIAGTFRPEGSFATFSGEPADGTWTLEVTDDFGTDSGTIIGWTLSLTAAALDDADGDLWVDSCGDCDALDGAVAPNQPELCDGLDNDCDAAVLPEGETDGDLDGSLSCDDCDDVDPNSYPGAPEVCDTIDNDCDGDATGTDPDLGGDGDGDTWADGCGDCAPSDALVYPGAPEICDDAVDQDCDTLDAVGDPDSDGATNMLCGGLDCDSADPAIYPGAPESCDTIDSDCDGLDDSADVHVGAVPGAPVVQTQATLPAPAITDNTTTIDTTTVVAPGLAVVSVAVVVNITHTYVGDLEIKLIAPSGVEVMLADNDGGAGENLTATRFDDGAASSFGAVVAANEPFTGDWSPVQPLAAMTGASVDGVWQLSVRDTFSGDAGTIDSWTLEFETMSATDADFDGFVGSCGDCDDANPAVNPGGTEVECDGLDNDCDGADSGAGDLDGDLYGCADDCDDLDPLVNPGVAEVCGDGLDNDCEPLSVDAGDGDGDGAVCEDDCDDLDPLVNPAATEALCDNVDNDCEVATADVGDADGDGVACDTDCDDANIAVLPGSTEIPCNTIDDDCDVLTNGEADVDGDGAGCGTDCNEGDAGIAPGLPEICNDGIDQDCDALTVDLFDADADGSTCVDDCDDDDATVAPGTPETCGDGVDQNCDGTADEDIDAALTLGDADSVFADLCGTEFPFCGSTWTGVHVGSDGRVWFDDGSATTLASVLNLENEAPGIAVMWTDLDPSLGGTVSIVEDRAAGSIEIAWDGVALGGAAGSLNTHSLTLFEDGMAEVVFDATTASSVVVGWACGAGATTVDLSALAGDVIGFGTEDGIVESFDGVGSTFDLVGTPLSFCLTAGTDADGDGYTDLCGDCDDAVANVSPLGAEFCNGLDDNCDGEVDNVDQDEDGFFAPGCGGDDCDDGDAAIYPNAEEICDGEDSDCDGTGDGDDQDGDGFLPCGGTGDCDNGDDTIYPGAPEVCDGVDQDCDQALDNGFEPDADDDGHSNLDCGGDDCDDTEAAIYGGAEEVCADTLDNDCDGATDDVDADGDGSLSIPCGGDDCDDTNGQVAPDATEVPYDGLDNDCTDGDLVDSDGDGFAGDQSAEGTDCDDTNAAINLEATEACDDTVDNDCDGSADGEDTDCSTDEGGCTCSTDTSPALGGSGMALLALSLLVRRRGARRG